MRVDEPEPRVITPTPATNSPLGDDYQYKFNLCTSDIIFLIMKSINNFNVS